MDVNYNNVVDSHCDDERNEDSLIKETDVWLK